jgi:hypothetical protein
VHGQNYNVLILKRKFKKNPAKFADDYLKVFLRQYNLVQGVDSPLAKGQENRVTRISKGLEILWMNVKGTTAFTLWA